MAETVLFKHSNNVQEFMCQSWGQSVDELYHRGMAVSSIDRQRVVIKVPVDKKGTMAATALIASGVRVCLTACYDSKQALVAASCGAEYLAPYLGRMTDAGKDGLEECARMQRIVDGLGSDTRILVASIRNVQSMTELAQTGLDTFTFSPDVARMLFDEPLTRKAAVDFEQAAFRMSEQPSALGTTE
jgi:transaldolase